MRRSAAAAKARSAAAALLIEQGGAAAGSGADVVPMSTAALIEILLECADELDILAPAAVEVAPSASTRPDDGPPPVPMRPKKKAGRGSRAAKTIATLNTVKAVAERDRIAVPHGHSILDKVKAVAERSSALSVVAVNSALHRHPRARAAAEPRPPAGPPPVPVPPRKKKSKKKKRRASEAAAAAETAAEVVAEQKVEDLPFADADPWLLEDRIAALRLRSSAAVLADTASTGSLRLTIALVPHVHTKYCDRVKHVCPFESGHLRSGSAHDATTATRFVEGEVLRASVLYKGLDVTAKQGLACCWWRLPSLTSTPPPGGRGGEEEEAPPNKKKERVLVGSEATYRMAAADACCFIQLECTYTPGEGKASVSAAARPRGPVIPGRPAVYDISIRCPGGEAMVGGTLEATGRYVALVCYHAALRTPLASLSAFPSRSLPRHFQWHHINCLIMHSLPSLTYAIPPSFLKPPPLSRNLSRYFGVFSGEGGPRGGACRWWWMRVTADGRRVELPATVLRPVQDIDDADECCRIVYRLVDGDAGARFKVRCVPSRADGVVGQTFTSRPTAAISTGAGAMSSASVSTPTTSPRVLEAAARADRRRSFERPGGCPAPPARPQRPPARPSARAPVRAPAVSSPSLVLGFGALTNGSRLSDRSERLARRGSEAQDRRVVMRKQRAATVGSAGLALGRAAAAPPVPPVPPARSAKRRNSVRKMRALQESSRM